ncbi:DNA-binding response regulator [Leucobacter sp. OLJS4]|uniref:response regulator transcription factor n=1 Tax=unclassified Leucobacter TaxID=2621730 RepID=UPI000C1A4476|nr:MULTISPECIES: response regulator transcription factor [unclassified Leucobacter]PII81596.1 DNA-binding response regulator [Leucobacter sp. OLCALW19]PII86268.1 DNA-binding response regulator [Leucobacter sp. OLTLW20]PII90163.1 DNA-binding response regulator [Leucobacter sp. OLAS13]PII97196.1 DNA-binding response regulator [Leucobacter sp. OLDS2]PIJ01508.1 DNA-binding response regulator [Leucobacter sp. OLCS4]
MIRVLVVDDQPLIRQAVADILAVHDDLDVIGTAADGREAIAEASRLRPDVVLMDIRMPDVDGIRATEAICAEPGSGEVRVLVLTTFEEEEYVVSALRAGASGFIGKGAEPDDIARAVRAVHAGDTLLSPVATRALISRYVMPASGVRGTGVPAELSGLTEREVEVLLLVARGRSNQELAEQLFISPHTAKTHVNRIMSKVGAHDRAQLVILAYESGLLAPGE